MVLPNPSESLEVKTAMGNLGIVMSNNPENSLHMTVLNLKYCPSLNIIARQTVLRDQRPYGKKKIIKTSFHTKSGSELRAVF